MYLQSTEEENILSFFQLKLNVPSKKLQESFIKKEKNEINQNLKKSKILKNYQLENFSIKEIEKLFTENKIEKFVDYEFKFMNKNKKIY